jgi:hypothetical protein
MDPSNRPNMLLGVRCNPVALACKLGGMIKQDADKGQAGHRDSLHAEVADALARGLITPAEVAGLHEDELQALVSLGEQALAHQELEKACTLAQAAVVLAPYTKATWDLLARTLRRRKTVHLAAYAEQAVRLLSPRQAQTPALAGDIGHKEVTQTLVLHDGRALPLTTTPVAVHHDTVSAQQEARRPMDDEGLAWATRTLTQLKVAPPHATGDLVPPPPAPVTKTSIVMRDKKRPNVPASQADTQEEHNTQTSEVARPSSMTAAQRRLHGWPMTDEVTLTALAPSTR